MRIIKGKDREEVAARRPVREQPVSARLWGPGRRIHPGSRAPNEGPGHGAGQVGCDGRDRYIAWSMTVLPKRTGREALRN